MNPYDLETERIAHEVKARGARRVLIQAPDGLKQYLREMYGRLSSDGAEVFVSTDPCYGACDLAERTAEAVGADLIVHVGHLKFDARPERIPTIYIPAPHIIEVGGVCRIAAQEMKSRNVTRVGIVSNIQHQGYVQEFMSELMKHGIQSIVDGTTGGLVLGCRTEAAERIDGKVDVFLFIGGGEFHALGIAMAVNKDVLVADPYRGELRDMSKLKKLALARRWWAIMESTKAKTFGIVVVTKTGQYDLKGALGIRRALEERGRGTYLLATDEVNWDRLAGFSFIDAFIVTGCPRIALDNQENFPKPMLSAADVEELLRRV